MKDRNESGSAYLTYDGPQFKFQATGGGGEGGGHMGCGTILYLTRRH